MKKLFFLIITLSSIYSIKAQDTYLWLEGAGEEGVNGAYELVGKIELKGKSFDVYEGPLPKKDFQIKPILYSNVVYMWNILEKLGEKSLYYSTLSTDPSPPLTDWNSRMQSLVPKIEGNLSIIDIRKKQKETVGKR